MERFDSADSDSVELMSYDFAYDSDFRFLLGQKRSYDSDSDSDSDSVAKNKTTLKTTAYKPRTTRAMW